MPASNRVVTRIQDQDDAPALGAPQDGYILVWDNATSRFVATAPSGGGAVDSVFGRTGAVVAVSGDYLSSQVTDDSNYGSGGPLLDSIDNLAQDIQTVGAAKQDASAKLTALDALTWVANSIIQLTSTSAAAVVTLASHVWTFLQSADAAAARSAIGAGTGDGDLLAANNLSDVTASTARTNLGLVAGGTGDIWIEKAGDTMSGALLMGTNYIQAQHFRPVSSTYYFESSAGATSYYAIWGIGQHRLFFNSNPASAPSAVIEINARAVGAAQDNFGASIEWKLETNTINDVPAGRMGVQWQTATHASRVPDMVAYLTDSADEREIWRGRANGSAAAIGFLGATPVARQAHIADPSGGATQDAEARTAINAILVVLENLGFTATS